MNSVLTERRRGAFPPELLVRVGLAWALVSGMLIAITWPAIAGHHYSDPDDIMRLLQVRDLLAGQSWFDVTQSRVDAAGGGVAMHWSRLVDVPLALVIFLLTPLVGASGAELAASVIVPLVTLALVMLLAARIAWRVLGEEEATLTSLVLAISIPVLFQLAPMRIDHHGWQFVCGLAAMNGLMARDARLGGFAIGASLAAWLSISIEGLPVTAIIFAVLALRWLRSRAERTWLVAAMQSLAVTSIALFLASRGIGLTATYCDAISPLHLAMFAWGALVLTLTARAEPAPRGMVVAGFALAGGGALAMLLVAAPFCATGGGFSALDPLVARHWHANILEGRPMWDQVIAMAAQYLVGPLIGLISAISLATHSRDWLRRFWSDYALILAGALIVSLFVARAGAFACVLAAPPLAWQVRSWLRTIRLMDRPAPRMAAMIAIACALLPAIPAMLLTSAIPARASIAATADKPIRATQCRVRDAAHVLQQLPRGEIYAPLDIAPGLLLESDHNVVATGHHRGHEAMRALIATALGSSEQARATLRARGTTYVAMCPNSAEARTYAEISPEGFAARLATGDAPAWLETVEVPGDTGLDLYRVTGT